MKGKAPEDSPTFESITLFESHGALILAERVRATPSGDWSETSSSYYRPDGTLAFVFAELRTFHGNVRVETRLYLDASGTVLRRLESVFDLEGGTPRKTTGFERQEPILIKTAQDLKSELGFKTP